MGHEQTKPTPAATMGSAPKVVAPAVPVPAVPVGLTDKQFAQLQDTIIFSVIAAGLLTSGIERARLGIDVLRFGAVVKEAINDANPQ